MGSRMPDLPLIPWMDRTLHPFWQKNIDWSKKPNIPASFERKLMFSKKYKDQNDRIGKIYRFEWSLDYLLFKNQSKSTDWEKISVSSSILISESACWKLFSLRFLGTEKFNRFLKILNPIHPNPAYLCCRHSSALPLHGDASSAQGLCALVGIREMW